MGRKIPAKKHRGVKDPLLQQAKRLESLKGKINAPPKDPDEQPMPRSLIRLFGLPDPKKKDTATKRRQTRTRHITHAKDDGHHDASENPISRLHKLPGESGRGFSLRINSAMKALQSPEEDVDYPQDLEAEDYKGQQMAEQRERRAKKRRRAEKAAARAAGAGGPGGAGAAGAQPLLTRTQKFALKKKAKKMKTLEASQEKAELVYERVAFGDVTHAPPALPLRALPLPPGASATRGARRGLLLAAPAAERERARLAAVAAYRSLRRNKYKHKHRMKKKEEIAKSRLQLAAAACDV